MGASTDLRPAPPRILLTTWRRQGKVWGEFVRDVVGVEVQYVQAVQAAGGLALLAPQAPGADPRHLVEGVDGLLLIGGEDLAAEVSGVDAADVGTNTSADRDRWEISLLDAAVELGVPVLAICRGMQLLNAARGGTLHGDIAGSSADHPAVPSTDLQAALAHRHETRFEEGSRLAAAYGVLGKPTNSLHHQAVDRVGTGLVVTARAADGVVEGLELPAARWCVGVEWHPELLPDDPAEAALFRAFVDQCASDARRAA